MQSEARWWTEERTKRSWQLTEGDSKTRESSGSDEGGGMANFLEADWVIAICLWKAVVKKHIL